MINPEQETNIFIPASVPTSKKNDYVKNYKKLTKGENSLLLFAGDHKIEHLNKDFYGEKIPKEVADPEYLFKIASKTGVGAFATQLGLIDLYGKEYKNLNYVVKLNSKTNLVSTKQKDPISLQLYSIDDVVLFSKNSGISIVGVGYTVYIGSEFESEMLNQAAQIVFKAHRNGLVAILWIYPRGKAVKNERSEDIIAGAAGVGSALGADFVKLNSPDLHDFKKQGESLKQATLAAGKTKIVCSGGKFKDEKTFLEEIYYQVNLGKTFGVAIGRNIYQRTLNDAVKLCKAIESVINKEVDFNNIKKII